MTPTSRIMILALSCFIGFQYFQFTYFISLTVQYCSGLAEFWFNETYSMSPFWSFSLFFFIAFLWAIAECHALFYDRTSFTVRAAILAMVLLFLFCVAFMQLSHYQSHEVLQGKRALEDYWAVMDEINYERLRKRQPGLGRISWRERDWIRYQEFLKKYPDELPGWNAYLWENTCRKGVEISSLSDVDWEELDAKFEFMWIAYYRQMEVDEVRENLFNNFG